MSKRRIVLSISAKGKRNCLKFGAFSCTTQEERIRSRLASIQSSKTVNLASNEQHQTRQEETLCYPIFELESTRQTVKGSNSKILWAMKVPRAVTLADQSP